MSALLVLIGVGIIGYMWRMENLEPLDRPLLWNDIALTIGVLVGLIFIAIGVITFIF